MLSKILIGLAVILVIFAVVVATRPDDFRVTRSATMAATPAVIFEQVNDFHKWDAWSPWAKLDPNSKVVFEGPTSGKGAIFKWSGNNEVGEGQQTIIDSRPAELVQIKLDFIRPFAGTNTVDFTFKPEGPNTLVTWSMYGKNNFIGKAMSLVMDCDKMLGGFFEKGLASLKSIVETAPKA